jgi:multidrug efflux pump subunit AcrB
MVVDFSRPRSALCIILGLLAASFFILGVWGKNTSPNSSLYQSSRSETFTITQRFYGVDAAAMERMAAVPLEDALAKINGIKRLYSSCENGRVRVTACFEGNLKGRYEAVREAAQQVYEVLPSAAQRPEISGSGDSRIPVFTAAVTGEEDSLGTVLERTVKPALEGIPGAGDVEVSGRGLKEILIILKSEESSARKIGAIDVASLLGSNDLLLPGGSIRSESSSSGALEIPVMVDGRYGSMEELRRAIIPLQTENGLSFAFLEDIAELTGQERNYENRARLNGKEAAIIAVMGGGADPGKLSSLIREELAKFPDLEFTVLSDRGEAERKALDSALSAALQGSCAVALLSALLCSGKRKAPSGFAMALVCSLTVPVVIFFSAALLVLLGFSLDKLVLAGLSAGVGAAVDAAILSAEYFRSCRRNNLFAEGKKAMEALRFPLISGALTTVIALVPLMAADNSGMNSVALAIGAVNIIAMILALTLLPPLFLWRGAGGTCRMPFHLHGAFARIGASSAALLRPLERKYKRGSAALVRLLIHKPLPVTGFWVLLSLLGIIALGRGGADVGGESSEDSVYAQVEFDGGLHMEESDKFLALYGTTLKEQKKYPGIINVQTLARTGTGSVLVSFDPQLVNGKTVRELLRSTPVSEGFVYIVESSGEERSWRIKISGDEEEKCRELAVQAARICASVPEIMETVFNFKEGSPRLNLEADRERLALNGLSLGQLGQTVRSGIHGPVAYKRMGINGETDVRIRGGGDAVSSEAVLEILVKGQSAPILLGSLARGESARETSSIQREDRRRSASLSIRTGVMDPRRVRDRVMKALEELELPPGYSIEFDPEAVKAAEEVSGRIYLFILALLFCYMLIAAFKESFTFPLAVLAVVPPSLSIPALYMVLRSYPLNAVSAAAFVAVSGLAVNAAVLTADALQQRHIGSGVSGIYRVFRKRLPVLAATTLTTIAGAVPFLFIRSNAALVLRTLSLVSALGVAASVLCAVTLIPALVILFPRLLHSWRIKP